MRESCECLSHTIISVNGTEGNRCLGEYECNSTSASFVSTTAVGLGVALDKGMRKSVLLACESPHIWCEIAGFLAIRWLLSRCVYLYDDPKELAFAILQELQ